MARESLWIRALPALLIAFAHAGPALAGERALDVQASVKLAFERNPDVRAAYADLEAARAELRGAELLLQSNPDLDLAAGSRLESGNSTPEVEVALSQPLELGGRRRARIDAARGGVQAAEARLAGRRNGLAAEVRQAFARGLAARALRELAMESHTLAQQALEAAEHRERAGDASRLEVNAARVDLGRTARAVQLAAGRELQALGELRLLLSLEPTDGLALSGDLGTPREPNAPLAELIAEALQRRPELAAARADAESRRSEERLADTLVLPAPRVGASYGTEEGAHIVQGTLGIELPLFNRNQAGRGAARARATQAQIELQALQRRVAQEVELAEARRRLAVDALAAYGDGILRAAEENLTLVNDGYRAGQLDVYQMLLMRREAVAVREGHIEALTELHLADAELERALGRVP